MPFDFQQFQIIAEPPPSTFPAIQFFESDWHLPWSEPVRFRVDPRRQIALIVSGLFAPVLNPDTQITQDFESKWHFPWSEPKRFRASLGAYRSPFASTFFDNTPNPSNLIQGWFQEFRGPVWPKKGLGSRYQQVLAYHPRMLPPPNVTITMSMVEVNTDDAEFDVWVYTEPPVPIDLTAVNVSVTEIPAGGTGGSVSLKETEG